MRAGIPGLMALVIACGEAAESDTGSVTDTDTDTDADTDTDTDTDADSIEIAGVYLDAYGATHTIGDTSWEIASAYGASTYWFTAVDNETDHAIAENGAKNLYSAGLYSRFDWFDDGGELYFCQSAYDAPDPAAAEAASADPGDLATGCGAFPWSTLTP